MIARPSWASLAEPLRSPCDEITGWAFARELGEPDAARAESYGFGLLGFPSRIASERAPHVALGLAHYVAARRRFPFAAIVGVSVLFADQERALEALTWHPSADVTIHTGSAHFAVYTAELIAPHVRSVRAELLWRLDA